MPALGAPPFIHILCCKCSQGSPSIRFCDIVQFRRVVTRVIDNDTVRAPTDPGRLTLAHSVHSARITRSLTPSPSCLRLYRAGLYGPGFWAGFIGPGARMASHVPCACPLISAYPYVHAVCAYSYMYRAPSCKRNAYYDIRVTMAAAARTKCKIEYSTASNCYRRIIVSTEQFDWLARYGRAYAEPEAGAAFSSTYRRDRKAAPFAPRRAVVR